MSMLLDRSKQWGRGASWGVYVIMGQGAPSVYVNHSPQIMNVNSETKVFVWGGEQKLLTS